MNNTIAVIGLQWGDEGKGKVVDWLSAQALHVARFQGGHNAGHSLVHKEKKIILHLLPSGVLRARAFCYIGNGVVVSPAALLEEINMLREMGIDLERRLFVATNAALILPYHQRIDCAREKKNNIGTTRRGIGPAHEDKAGRRALRFYDICDGSGKAQFVENAEFYNDLLARHGEAPIESIEAQWNEICAQVEQLQPYLCSDISSRLAQAQKQGEKILLEGAQGALLDIEQGTYPYTTSAPCLASASASGLGVDLQPHTVGVTKSYCTRVGNGSFPTEMKDDIGKIIADKGGEFGSTTGRARRIGWLDIPLLRHAIRINACRKLVVTKLDILDALDEIKVCTAYEMGEEQYTFPPAEIARLNRCKPIYRTLPGWRGQDTMDITEEEKLPAAAQRYLRLIEELCEIPVAAISTGAEREAIIARKALF